MPGPSIALLTIIFAGAPAQSDGGLAVVRLISVQAAPADWLEVEEQILDVLSHTDESLVPPSIVADTWDAPGFRFDRARSRVRVALAAVRDARHRGTPADAEKHLRDCNDLLELGPLVGVMPKSLLRSYHRDAALVELEKSASGKALKLYLALTGVSGKGDPELPADMVEQTTKQLKDVQPAGIAVEVGRRGAVVYLDGERIGAGSTRRYNVRPGTHYLRVVAPGRLAFGERIELKPGKIIRRTVQLEGGSDGLERRAAALLQSTPKGKEVARLKELATKLGTPELLLLAPSRDGMRLRLFDASSGVFGDLHDLALDAGPGVVEQTVMRATGRAAPTVGVIAVPTPEPQDPLTARTLNEPDDLFGGDHWRWVWVGAGAAVVVGVVLTIVLVAGGDDGPNRATVWLCPAGDPCAP